MEDDDAEPPANNDGANNLDINANVENADVSNTAATADTGASGVDSITSDRGMSARHCGMSAPYFNISLR